MKILVINAGSSTHKLSLFNLINGDPVDALWEGSLDWGREDLPIIVKAKTKNGANIEQQLASRDVGEGFKILLDSLWQGSTQVIGGLSEIERIGHRVVHGGHTFERPTLINGKVKEHIRALVPLAPLHNPANLEGIELMESHFSSLPQIAVFDTSFHMTMPDMVKTYPVPWEWKEKGVHRYGFHGISHQYCAERTGNFLKKNSEELKIINCHLGNGCSLCAIQEGKSYETTMGLTPLEGLMMGTRCGSIDPGILLYLQREYQMSPSELDEALNFASGLKGIGGHSDMRELLNLPTDRATLAIQMFVHRLKVAIGALAASLNGCDVLSFTAGIGENAPTIRAAVCKGLSFLNLSIDDKLNQKCQPDMIISAASSHISVLVLHTREEWMIARECYRLILN